MSNGEMLICKTDIIETIKCQGDKMSSRRNDELTKFWMLQCRKFSKIPKQLMKNAQNDKIYDGNTFDIL